MQKLDSPMVNVSTNLKTVTISGLSKETGDATLTATIRRSSLSSKEKTIVRCSDLVITNSESSGSSTNIWYIYSGVEK